MDGRRHRQFSVRPNTMSVKNRIAMGGIPMPGMMKGPPKPLSKIMFEKVKVFQPLSKFWVHIRVNLYLTISMTRITVALSTEPNSVISAMTLGTSSAMRSSTSRLSKLIRMGMEKSSTMNLLTGGRTATASRTWRSMTSSCSSEGKQLLSFKNLIRTSLV